MSAARLKHFGWGREGEGLTAEDEAFVMPRAEARFGTALKPSASAPRLEDIKLEAPRVAAPASLPFAPATTTTASRTPMANHILSSSAASHATMRARLTSSPIRATRPT
jgi:alkyldihydroxyacetonephosphate synthase